MMISAEHSTGVGRRLELAVPFDLSYTLDCGQVFRWRAHDGVWHGVIGHRLLELRQEGSVLYYASYPEMTECSELERYFRMDDDLDAILAAIHDERTSTAIERYRGLRIIRQDPWECLVSYVCSRNCSIPKITAVVESLAYRFGEPIYSDIGTYYSFPSPQTIAEASVNELERCRFRFGRPQASELKELATLVHQNELELNALKDLDYGSAVSRLKALRGVGDKVADCVALFALDKLEAFPLDTHTRRIMCALYFHGEVVSDKSIKQRAKSFGRYAGYAQEYLFYYARTSWAKRASASRAMQGNSCKVACDDEGYAASK